MVLSFEFLRLYINAFAFQATLNRAVSQASQRNSGMKGQTVSTLFSEVAGNPDARFIYESIDAANSLLSILNSFIDPVAGLKHMPLKYCLYVIYAAVFLFKVRSTLTYRPVLGADKGVYRQGWLAPSAMKPMTACAGLSKEPLLIYRRCLTTH